MLFVLVSILCAWMAWWADAQRQWSVARRAFLKQVGTCQICDGSFLSYCDNNGGAPRLPIGLSIFGERSIVAMMLVNPVHGSEEAARKLFPEAKITFRRKSVPARK